MRTDATAQPRARFNRSLPPLARSVSTRNGMPHIGHPVARTLLVRHEETLAVGKRAVKIMTSTQKDFLASIGVGMLSMILFVLLMGTVVLWGQSTGQKVRTKLTTEQAPPAAAPDSSSSL